MPPWKKPTTDSPTKQTTVTGIIVGGIIVLAVVGPFLIVLWKWAIGL